MAGVRFLDGVYGEKTDCVDALLVGWRVGHDNSFTPLKGDG
jgi:hypothetical protein